MKRVIHVLCSYTNLTARERRPQLLLATSLCTALLIAVLEFTGFGDFVFNRGSEVFTIFHASPLLVGIGFLVLLVTCLTALRLKVFARILLMSAGVAVWMLFGRAAALSWDGRMAAGWFFLRTTTLQLREETEDMEDYAKHWQVRVIQHWWLEFESAGRSERVFVGPCIMSAMLDLLRDKGFVVTT